MKVDCPKPVPTSYDQTGACSDENINRILKFLYNNQDFSSIRHELNPENVSAFYSQAYVMKCTNLMKALDELIIQEVLCPENAAQFYLDSIRVSLPILNSYLSKIV